MLSKSGWFDGRALFLSADEKFIAPFYLFQGEQVSLPRESAWCGVWVSSSAGNSYALFIKKNDDGEIEAEEVDDPAAFIMALEQISLLDEITVQHPQGELWGTITLNISGYCT